MPSGSDNGGEQFDSVIADFLEASETGRCVDETEWLRRYPQHAAGLRNFFDDRRQVERLSAPLRAVVESPMPGDVRHALGDFQIIREVGRGGMGIVYEAQQPSLGRRIALKVLPLAAVLDGRQLQRFKNEAQAAAQLRHPNIVGVHSVGCERGVHFYAMEFIEGRSLAQLIDQHNGSTPSHEFFRSVADLGFQAAAALDYAHQRGVIHRDIKPANLLVDADQHLWITDFGLARTETGAGMTATGDVVGTVRYMSPEQALGRRTIDHHTDIYSLGVTLYELLILRPAFPGNDRPALLRQVVEDSPPHLRQLNKVIPADLETIVLKAMHKSPEDRYATAQEMADDLQRFLAGQPIRAKRLTSCERLTRWTVRHKALVAATVVVLAFSTLGLAMAAALFHHQRTRVIAASADLKASLSRERGLRQAAQRAQQQAREQAQRALANAALARSHLAELQAQAAAYEINVRDGDSSQKLQFVPESVLNWDHSVVHPSRKVSVGSVFVWLRDHRPEVVGTIFRHVNGDQKSTPHEFHSFALEPLTAKYRGISVWSPVQAGIQLRPIRAAPVPAESAHGRRAQMRMLASRFTATTETDGLVERLQLHPDPFYVYESSAAAPVYGGLFAFRWMTDPELLLMVEVRGRPPDSRWHYALARLSRKFLAVDYQRAQVWSVPAVPTLGCDRNIVECPDVRKRPYIIYRPALVPEIHIGDRHRELAASYDRLGRALQHAGRHKEAAEARTKASKILHKSGAPTFSASSLPAL